MIYWMTGLSGAGKTTIAKRIQQLLPIEVIGGDTLRQTLCQNLGFCREDRMENLRRTAYLTLHLSKHTNVLVDCITPYEEARRMITDICKNVRLVYIRASFPTCERRDPKGLYKKAVDGLIPNFTGIHDNFDMPTSPDVTIDTEEENIHNSTMKLYKYICGISRKYSLFIGRWQPFHVGHEHIIRRSLAKGNNIAIGVRDTPISKNDPFPLPLRIEIISAVFHREIEAGKVHVFPIIDINSVNISRNVGYEVNEIEVSKQIETISATKIRKKMIEGSNWTEYVPEKSVPILLKNLPYLHNIL